MNSQSKPGVAGQESPHGGSNSISKRDNGGHESDPETEDGLDRAQSSSSDYEFEDSPINTQLPQSRFSQVHVPLISAEQGDSFSFDTQRDSVPSSNIHSRNHYAAAPLGYPFDRPQSPELPQLEEIPTTAVNIPGSQPLGFPISAYPQGFTPLEARIPAMNQSQPSATAFRQDSPLANARAPSPSDAALVRKATLVPGEGHKTVAAVDHFREFYDPASRSYRSIGVNPCLNPAVGYPYSTSMTDMQWNDPAHEPMPPLECAYAPPSQPPHYDSQSVNDGQSEADNISPLQRTEPGCYQQGPFSKSYRSFRTIEIPPPSRQQSASPLPPKRCLVRLKYDKAGKVIKEKQTITSSRQKLDSVKPSKVDISNLVNPHADGSRSLKRKSDEMTSDSITEKLQRSSVKTGGRKDAKSKILDPTSPVIEPLTQGQAYDEMGLFVGAVEEGPVRKKSKTSNSSKAGTIGKVVSGVCLGLAGAFAAFVAATPADVWEEALREAVKLK